MKEPGARGFRRAAQLLALAAGSMALVLLVLEGIARLSGYQPTFDVYSKPSLFWRHDSLLGWSHEPLASGPYVGPRPWPIEFSAQVSINSAGLRGPEIPERRDEVYRILVLGDSLVAGFEVAYEDTFVALVGEQLSRETGKPVEVINAGVRGYGTDQNLLYFREHGRSLAPDLVVYALSPNDALDNITLHRMRRPFGKAAFRLEPDGGLELVGHPVREYPLCSAWSLDAEFEPRRLDGARSRAFCWLQTRLADHSALFSFVTLRVRRSPTLLRLFYELGSPQGEPQAKSEHAIQRASFLPLLPVLLSLVRAGAVATDDPTPAASHAWALTTTLIAELAREVETSGARFMLLMRPESWDLLDGQVLVDRGIEPRTVGIAGGEIAARGVRFRNDAHLNESGHRLTAQGLATLLKPVMEAELDRRRSEGASAPAR